MKSLKVSEDVWQQAKIEAAKQKITLNKFITQAIKNKLEKTKEKEKQ